LVVGSHGGCGCTSFFSRCMYTASGPSMSVSLGVKYRTTWRCWSIMPTNLPRCDGSASPTSVAIFWSRQTSALRQTCATSSISWRTGARHSASDSPCVSWLWEQRWHIDRRSTWPRSSAISSA
jgi:hypothetical protein